MKRFTLLFFLFIYCSYSFGQTDSSRISLGRLQLQKDFVQGITIQAKDLEQLPFSSLTDVIDTWLNGDYTNRENVKFVVDGLLLADPNIYHISDIESLTLVQNAVSQLNGAFRQQQLVLVQLKKGGKNNKGIIISGQTDRVDRPLYDYYSREKFPSYKNSFHNYHAGAYQTMERSGFGVSLGFLRDVMPKSKRDATSVETADHFNRFQGNAFYWVDIAKGHRLDVLLNYQLQPSGTDYHNSTIGPGGGYEVHNRNDQKDHYFEGQFSLHSQFNNGFFNELSFGYARSRINNDFQSSTESFMYHSISNGFNRYKIKSLGLQNSFRWQKQLGNVQVSPALNFTYRHFYSRYRDLTLIDYGGFNSQAFASETRWEANKIMLTPSMEFKYSNLASIQAGVMVDVSKSKQGSLYPFVTLGFSPSAMMGSEAVDWKIFGSYAKAGFFADEGFTSNNYTYSGLFTTYPYFLPASVIDSDFYNRQAGTSLGLLHNKLVLGYNFEERQYLGEIWINGWGVLIKSGVLTRSKTHQLSVTAVLSANKYFGWRTTVTATSIRNKFENFSGRVFYAQTMGDQEMDHRSWTGGWNNRWHAGKWVAGADVLYHLKQRIKYYNNDDQERNLFSLKNVFIGFQAKLRGRDFQFYLNGRNVMQDKDHAINLDSRRYMGAGFQLNF